MHCCYGIVLLIIIEIIYAFYTQVNKHKVLYMIGIKYIIYINK